MDYASVEARDKAWTELRAYLESSDRFKRPGGEEADLPLFQDGKGRFAAFATSGPRLIVGISPDRSAAMAVVRQSRPSG